MILVLEDARERVEWLRDAVGDVPVAWCESVGDFLDVLRDTDPSLIILDHDLGLAVGDPTFACGEDGLCGMDAVDRMGVPPCPVLVWSINPVRAPMMARALRARGASVTWAPFGTGACGAVVGHALLNMRKVSR